MGELRELRVEITTACLMRCGYCYLSPSHRNAPSVLREATFRARLREALPLGLETVSFTGGEPLLEPDLLLRLLRVARSEGLAVGLLTSGLGLTKEVADALAGAGLGWARISVDAAPEDWEARQGLRRAFDHAQRAIGAFKALGIPIILRPTATPHNTHGLRHLLDFAAAQGVVRVEIQPYMPSGVSSVDERYWMPPSVHFGALRRIHHLKQMMSEMVDLQLYSGWFEFLSPYYASDAVQMSKCGRSFLFLDAEGRMKTCAMSRRYLLLPDEGTRTLADVWWEDPYLLALRQPIPSGLCSDCDKFTVCSKTWCPAVNTVFGRRVNDPIPSCPRVMQMAQRCPQGRAEMEIRRHEEDASTRIVSWSTADHPIPAELRRP